MNVLKLALLGTAAVAAVSVSARASEISELIAHMEALNSRIAALESSASVPAGYQLLSVSEVDAIIIPSLDIDKDYGKKVTNIGILPTADVPASTNLQWSGFVRAAIVWGSDKDSEFVPGDPLAVPPIPDATITTTDSDWDVVSRAGFKVVGTTDTAIGEIGARIAFLGSVEARNGVNRSHDPSVATDGYWGWWKMTPELTFGGGVDGSLANSSNAFDNRCSCNYINTGGAFGHGDPTQLRLSYASGPISFAVALEDEGSSDPTNADSFDGFGVAGEMKYTGDTIGFDINAGYWDGYDDDGAALTTLNGDAAWTVNAGASMGLGDMASLGLAVGVGEDSHLAGSADRYTKVSMFLGLTLSDAVSAELGGAYTDYKGANYTWDIGAGVYYKPVSQLTLGLEGSYGEYENGLFTGSDSRAAVVSKWSF